MKIRLLILVLAFPLAFLMGKGEESCGKVSIVNFYPGSDIYQLEGHTVLRMQKDGRDLAVSWGTFDFEAPNFVYRFVKGETDYWMTIADFPLMLQLYQQEGRRVVEHPVLMDSAQIASLQQAIAQAYFNPSLRTYRYNYVKDNCATRPLAYVEQAIGSQIEMPVPTDATAKARSFRDVMRICHKNYPWYQFGIDLALGSGIDYEISNRERAFAPITLDNQLPQATANGQPITSAPIVLNEGGDCIEGPTPWFLTPVAVSALLLAICLGLTIRDIRRRRVTRWFDAALFGIYGLAGLLLTFLIFVSVHEATSPNWLYLWLNPLCLIVPIFIWLKNCKLVVFSYQIANFALLIVLAIIWPMSGQSGNAAFGLLIGCDVLRASNYIYVSILNRKRPA